jgi:osmotically-inducible protein OsmY
MSDKELRQEILTALEFEPTVDARNIGVAVEDGIVSLTGHVASLIEKTAAERAVHRIKGVRAVAENIEIRPSDADKTPDDVIAKEVADRLRSDKRIPADAIEITVQGGRVTLAGAVETEAQRLNAESVVRRIEGVAGVDNHVVVHPRVDAPDIQRRIAEALKQHTELEARNIRVTIDEGKVTIEGRVDNWQERDLVEDAAWSAPGVRSVDVRLTIG